MVASERSVFRSSALLSGLVTQEQLDEAEAVIRADRGDPYAQAVQVSDDQLAERLVAMNVLTNYQADQLKSGRTKLNLGPYLVTDFIGQGGMGHVFKAVHEVMGRECAVKVLPLNRSTPEAIASFRREIRTQAKLDHPNLVRAYDAGEDGKVHYLVVEYVPGIDLRRLVRSEGRLTVQQAAKIIMQAARGLHHAHERGLIHRDVKPGNILVTPDGVAKVSDLGLAGFIHEAEDDPRAGKIVGTADYLSPEQIRSPQEITAVSDIYSLGCTLYYAITGKVPYPGGTPASKAHRHLNETPWHPRRFNDEVSDEFVDIIADMMEKDPGARIQSAAEVAARLEPWASDSGPLPSHQMTRSPWMSPPLPTGSVDDDLGITMHETGSAAFDAAELVLIESESASQISQWTNSVASAGQETKQLQRVPPEPPPLISTEDRQASTRLSRVAYAAVAVAVAVPIALLVGGLIGLILGILLW